VAALRRWTGIPAPASGELLRRYRAAAGLSQAELAERAGLSERGIADLERGARSAPYPQTVRRLIGALSLTDDERARLLAARAQPARQVNRPGAIEQGEVPGQRTVLLPLTELVGRERECAAINARLANRPLVTLVGVGGVGKMRLALAVAAQVHPADFPDGVYFVELAALTDDGQVSRAVASTIGIPEQPGADTTKTLVQVLRTRRVLLVLDNCEHLIKSCAELTETLLRSCARCGSSRPAGKGWASRASSPGRCRPSSYLTFQWTRQPTVSQLFHPCACSGSGPPPANQNLN
jgi:transcriptional regulator with XRE-family HTH domain